LKTQIAKSLYSPEQETLCRLLKETREKAKLTQVELAKKISKPQSFIAKIERGERRLELIEFIPLIRAMGRDPVWFLKKYLKIHK
jgi:transcriptional regulator with XRE-family HTH domain